MMFVRILLALISIYAWWPLIAFGECVEPSKYVTDSISLEPSCIYKGDYIVVRSDVIFDCQGATLDGENLRPFGLRVDSQGLELKNVVIKNCKILNFTKNGIWVGWGQPDAEKAKSTERSDIYKRTPTLVSLNSTLVSGSGRVGIYIDDYVTNSRLERIQVERSGGPGLYLEHSSQGTHVTQSRFINNGAGKRENVAIDSSSNNIIDSSEFSSDVGNVFLYKNCWENALGDPSSVQRWMHSDHNLIERNQFSGKGVSVWVASRQSKDLRGFKCGDASLRPDLYIYRDFAQSNMVSKNVFSGAGVAVKIEDSYNSVVGNDFSKFDGVAVEYGAKYLYEVLGVRLIGLRLEGNLYKNGAAPAVGILYGAELAR